jgi:hypothetical protein
MSTRRGKTSKGVTEFETFVQQVYNKWDHPEKELNKDVLAQSILRCWGDPDKMAWWEICAASKRWGRCKYSHPNEGRIGQRHAA